MSRLAIVGCGISGLAAAIFLSRDGHEVTVFERFSTPESIGAGLLLQPSGLKILKELRLLDDVAMKSSRIDSLVGMTKDGRRIMDVSYRDLAPGLYGLGIHRANLFASLFDETIRLGITIETGIDVTGITHQSENAVVVSDSGIHIGSFDGVIVANGRQSSLRNLIDPEARDTPYPWAALWAVVDAPRSVAHNVLSQRYRSASVMVGMLPTGNHPATGKPCASFFWSMFADNHEQWKKTEIEHWQDEVAEMWPEITNTVQGIDQHSQLSFATYGDVIMRRYHRDNLVCIGDAAHAMSPQLGQGANLGLVDASILAQCLKLLPLKQAFALFTRRRRPHIRYCQLASRWLTPLFQSHSRLGAAVRDVSFPWLRFFPPAYKETLRTVAGVKTGVIFDRSIFDLSFDAVHQRDL